MIIVAHRGASGYAPENSLAAFKKAIDLNVDMIELDVQQCKSGELIVFHDYTLDRLMGVHKYISDLTLQELKQFNIAKSNEKIPTLQEVLDLINRQCKVNIELKSAHITEKVSDIIKIYIGKGWNFNDFIVSSFDHYEIKKFKELSPSVITGAIIDCKPIGYSNIIVNAYADIAVLYYPMVDKQFVADAHSKGIKVFVFTVNYPEDYKLMVNLDVDAIISDFPDIKNYGEVR